MTFFQLSTGTEEDGEEGANRSPNWQRISPKICGMCIN